MILFVSGSAISGSLLSSSSRRCTPKIILVIVASLRTIVLFSITILISLWGQEPVDLVQMEESYLANDNFFFYASMFRYFKLSFSYFKGVNTRNIFYFTLVISIFFHFKRIYTTSTWTTYFFFVVFVLETFVPVRWQLLPLLLWWIYLKVYWIVNKSHLEIFE